MGLVDGNVHSPRVPPGEENPLISGLAGRAGEGRVRRPCSEFEHAVVHGRHHVARDYRLWLLAPLLTFHSDDMSAEGPRASLKCGFGEKNVRSSVHFQQKFLTGAK